MIFNSLKKEALIILSDIHSIGVLLILPVAFMLIMTFAMSGQSQDVIGKINIKVTSVDKNLYVDAYQEYLQQQGFKITTEDKVADLVIHLPDDFEERLLTGLSAKSISLTLKASISPSMQPTVIQLIYAGFSKLRLHAYMLDSGDLDDQTSLLEQISQVEKSTDVEQYFALNIAEKSLASPTLYSVPSWIIFGIYFIVLPVSITVINEQQNGTLIRLKTFPISTSHYFFTKVSAFCLLSTVQFIILTLIGIFAVPLITAQPAITVNSWALYTVSALIIVISANALAFTIAALVSSYEQAIVLGGGINILLAAISGFMVPMNIMPEIMANIASWSPLYWSAEIIRATFMESNTDLIFSYLTNLLLFSVISLTIARFLFVIKIRKLMWN
ncbi:ABC transporter permease [Colwellia sp. E2M01]|uniref:ABC transporter permease n=1 Tax=Colwellia sp. E2M01 TaxID=2841561 RepID=UPI001C0A6074|nr:ABC transporter permease [Colwellia sp. E2M01]MBU2871607.1 ABC transporter permease [Colwellia sp. E2M01]